MRADQQTSEEADGTGVRGEWDDLRMGPGGGKGFVLAVRNKLPVACFSKNAPL